MIVQPEPGSESVDRAGVVAVRDQRDATYDESAFARTEDSTDDSLLIFVSEQDSPDSLAAREPEMIDYAVLHTGAGFTESSAAVEAAAVASDGVVELPTSPPLVRGDASKADASWKLEGQLDTVSSLQRLCASLDQRLAETEDVVRHIQQLVSSGAFQDLSARIDGRLNQTAQALRQIQRMLDVRPSASADHPRPAAHREALWRLASERLAPLGRVAQVYAHSALRLAWRNLQTALARGHERSELKRMAKRGAPVCVLVGALLIATIVAGPTGNSERGKPVTASDGSVVAGAVPDGTPSPGSPTGYAGTLSITSAPAGATVFVAGKAVGVTPLLLREQPAGSVAVGIAQDGFDRWSASVDVTAGRVTNIQARLRPIAK